MSNTFGRLFRLTTFGESHGKALGGVIDGCPAGLPLTDEDVQRELDRRKPGQAHAASTTRKEPDTVQLLSGVFEGKTTGTPIGFIIPNTNQHSSDYDNLRDLYRPEHADYPFDAKYGIRDHRGGGRSSGRETASRVAGGAVALKLLEHWGIHVHAYTLEIGGLRSKCATPGRAGDRPFFAPDEADPARWEALLAERKAAGDTAGGMVRLTAQGLPPGLGEPVFDKLDARIGSAMLGVGAVKGVELGLGFAVASSSGAANNDSLLPGTMRADGFPLPNFASNHAGGVLGGLSSSQPLVVTVAVKPISSIAREQHTINKKGEAVRFAIEGRHDVCAIPRIVPVLKAMLAMTLADFVLINRAARLD